jgi:hypothetical protein
VHAGFNKAEWDAVPEPGREAETAAAAMEASSASGSGAEESDSDSSEQEAKRARRAAAATRGAATAGGAGGRAGAAGATGGGVAGGGGVGDDGAGGVLARGIENDDAATCYLLALVQALRSYPAVAAEADAFAAGWLSRGASGGLASLTRCEALLALCAVAGGADMKLFGRNATASTLARRIRPTGRVHARHAQHDLDETFRAVLASAQLAANEAAAEASKSGRPTPCSYFLDSRSFERWVTTHHIGDCEERAPHVVERDSSYGAILELAVAAIPSAAVPADRVGTFAALPGDGAAAGELSASVLVNLANAALRTGCAPEQCSACGGGGDGTMRYTAYHLTGPRLLAVSVPRNIRSSSSFNVDVTPEERIELRRLGQPTAHASGAAVATYRLISVVYYRGSGSSGHYVAHCLRGGLWFRLDDGEASPLAGGISDAAVPSTVHSEGCKMVTRMIFYVKE